MSDNDYYVTVQSVMNFCKNQKVKFNGRIGIVESISMTKRRIYVGFNDGFKELKPIELEIIDDRALRYWTVADFVFVTDNFKLTDSEIADRLNRTEEEVRRFKLANKLVA